MTTNNFSPNNTFDAVIKAGIDSALKELHTCLPGVVISFDTDTQTADIQPTIKRKIGDDVVNLPVLGSVPVRFPKSTDFSISFPLAADDEVLLIFAERSLDTWLTHGGIQNPFDFRKHDLSDAFAIPMGYSQKNLIPSFPTANLEIKVNSGTGSITITPAGVISITGNASLNLDATEIVLNSGSDFAVRFTALETAYDELQDAFNNHVHSNTAQTANPTDLSGPVPTILQSSGNISLSKIDSIKVP